jgi:hypothetical protein
MEGVYITKTPRIEAALTELKRLIQERYPTAMFTDSIRLEPVVGFYLNVTVDVDDTDEVHDVIIDRLIDIQVEDELPVYVSIDQTPEQSEANLREQLAASKQREELAAKSVAG